MKHLIVGTAGHVDHGKTTLVKRLTGIDCDTHAEEKRRGITINLGFAYLDLPSGTRLGIVDVPGHKDFVHTMVGGATGIDLALLTVAVDSGVMPQTREHIQIMDVLGLGGGVVALTKCDMVDAALTSLCEQEVREALGDTFLEGAPVVPVSAVNGEGLERLVQCLEQTSSITASRPRDGVFRLYPDRVFAVSGFGTVVTGSVLGGSLRVGDSVYLLPGSIRARVRRLERHGAPVDEVVAGDRASLNLVGPGRSDIIRGMAIADRPLCATSRMDVRLRLFREAPDLDLWSHVTMHINTSAQHAKVHLIDRDRLSRGETGLAQVHLEGPCVVQPGDRFVARSTSRDQTLGGGEIIDTQPLHHRRRRPRTIEAMARIATGGLAALVSAEVERQRAPVMLDDIARSLNVTPEAVQAAIVGSHDETLGLCHYYGSDARMVVLAWSLHERLVQGVNRCVEEHHRDNPLDSKGKTAEEMVGMLGLPQTSAAHVALRQLLLQLVAQGKLEQAEHTFILPGHRVAISDELARQINVVDGYLARCDMSTPPFSVLSAVAEREGVSDERLGQILKHLVAGQKIYFVEGKYVHASVVGRCRTKLLTALRNHEDGISLAGFRDLVDGNRKTCMMLLSIYQAEGAIGRSGDLRVLTEKGAAEAQKLVAR